MIVNPPLKFNAVFQYCFDRDRSGLLGSMPSTRRCLVIKRTIAADSGSIEAENDAPEVGD